MWASGNFRLSYSYSAMFSSALYEDVTSELMLMNTRNTCVILISPMWQGLEIFSYYSFRILQVYNEFLGPTCLLSQYLPQRCHQLAQFCLHVLVNTTFLQELSFIPKKNCLPNKDSNMLISFWYCHSIRSYVLFLVQPLSICYLLNGQIACYQNPVIDIISGLTCFSKPFLCSYLPGWSPLVFGDY